VLASTEQFQVLCDAPLGARREHEAFEKGVALGFLLQGTIGTVNRIRPLLNEHP
jgi:hypothetical protein